MDRIRSDCFRFERMYLKNITYGCKEMRPVLISHFDGSNICDFFWCIHNIIDLSNLITGSSAQDDVSRIITDEELIYRRNWTVRHVNETDEHLDPELLKMPLMKLLKLEMEVLHKLRNQRTKLARRFLKLSSWTADHGDDQNSSCDDVDSFKGRVVENDNSAMDQLKTKLHKYKTLLEYQTLLSAAIEEKLVSGKTRLNKTHQTRLTLNFSTLLIFIQGLVKFWETEFYKLRPRGQVTDSTEDFASVLANTDPDCTIELPTGDRYINAKSGYGAGFIDRARMLPGLASFLRDAMIQLFIPDRKKRCKVGPRLSKQNQMTQEPKKDTDYSIFLASTFRVNDLKPKVLTSEKSDIHLRVVKDFDGDGPLQLSLKTGQVVKQKIGMNSQGMSYGWCRSHRLSKKHSGFYPADCVQEEDGA